MKNKQLNCIIFSLLIIIGTSGNKTFASDPGDVQNLQSIPAISADTMSVSMITYTWSYPSGYTEDSLSNFFISFNDDEFYSIDTSNFTDSNVESLNSSLLTIPIDTSSYTDVDIWFHIAAAKPNTIPPYIPIIGSTSSLGPYRIDNVPPTTPMFTALTETNEPTVQLTNIGAVGATKMCYWLSGFGSCNYENINTTATLTLPHEKLTYLINVRFKDDAGNVSNTLSKIINYYTPPDGDTVANVPALNEWGMIMFIGMLLLSSIKCMKKTD